MYSLQWNVDPCLLYCTIRKKLRFSSSVIWNGKPWLTMTVWRFVTRDVITPRFISVFDNWTWFLLSTQFEAQYIFVRSVRQSLPRKGIWERSNWFSRTNSHVSDGTICNCFSDPLRLGKLWEDETRPPALVTAEGSGANNHLGITANNVNLS